MCLYAYREGSLLPTTGSLLSSCTRTLAVFQYSKPETLERKARPSNPVARPTDQPTNLPPLPPTLSGQCTPNRHIWTKSNRILSKRFSRRAPPPPSLFPSTGGRKPYARRFSTKAGLLLLLLDSSRWRNGSRFRASLDFLSLSISLIPFFWEGRGKDRFFFRICFAERGREREEEGLVIRTGTLLRDIFVGCISN